jgi:hypothetical protein
MAHRSTGAVGFDSGRVAYPCREYHITAARVEYILSGFWRQVEVIRMVRGKGPSLDLFHIESLAHFAACGLFFLYFLGDNGKLVQYVHSICAFSIH